MTMISSASKQMLMDLAEKVSHNSYSPYSHFAVGAAVLCGNGKKFVGTNVENASLGLTVCAERVAVANAIAAGCRDIVAIAVFSEHDDVLPCGACRQFIVEFGQTIEIIYRRSGHITSSPILDLIPFMFCVKDIRK